MTGRNSYTPLRAPSVQQTRFFTDRSVQELAKQRAATLWRRSRQERGSALTSAAPTHGVPDHQARRLSHVFEYRRSTNGVCRLAGPRNPGSPPRSIPRNFSLALLQSTDRGKTRSRCASEASMIPTPLSAFLNCRRATTPATSRASTAAMGRDDGLQDRCLRSGLPNSAVWFGAASPHRADSVALSLLLYDVESGRAGSATCH